MPQYTGLVINESSLVNNVYSQGVTSPMTADMYSLAYIFMLVQYFLELTFSPQLKGGGKGFKTKARGFLRSNSMLPA